MYEKKRARGRPCLEARKVMVPFRVYASQLPAIEALVNGAVDTEKVQLRADLERMKRTNYDLAGQNAKLLEEVEGYKAILG